MYHYYTRTYRSPLLLHNCVSTTNWFIAEHETDNILRARARDISFELESNAQTSKPYNAPYPLPVRNTTR